MSRARKCNRISTTIRKYLFKYCY